MWPYLFTFAISLFAIHFVDRFYKNKVVFLWGSIVAVMFPVLLAGFRAPTVGSDMTLYIQPIFEEFQKFEKLEIVRDLHPSVEISYLILNDIVYTLTDSFVIFLIVAHLFIIIPLYKSAIKWRKKLSPVLFFFVFYCIFFQDTLSIVRQSCAISFSVLAITYFLEREYKKFGVLSIISIGFHGTAVIPLLFPLLYKMCTKFPVKKNYVYYIAVVIVVSFVLMNLDGLIIHFIQSGIVDMKYLIYTSEGDLFDAKLEKTNIVVKVAIMCYILIVLTKYKQNSLLDFFFLLSVIDFSFSLCGLILAPLERMGFYARIMTCISLPYLFRNYPLIYRFNGYKIRIPAKTILLSLLFFFWYYVYMLGDYDSTSNYEINPELFQ